jgi:hypothetical protein
MRSFREATRIFWGGLAEMPSYFVAVKEHAWEVLWGAGVIGLPFTLFTLIWQPSWWRASGYVLAAVVFLAGYQLWRDYHLRLERHIDIVQISAREWPVKQGEPHAYQRAKAYQIEIINRSEGVTIENVSVQLNAISPKWANWEFLPIPLHLRHDNPSRPEDQMRAFSLDPGEQRNVDFISAFQGDNRFSVIHVVPGATWEVPYTDRNRLQVRITGRNIPASFCWFKVSRDREGKLQCERET